MLSFEYDSKNNTLEIFFDADGKARLLASLERLVKPGDHEHLMTPSWSGSELSEERHGAENTLIHMVTLGVPKQEAMDGAG